MPKLTDTKFYERHRHTGETFSMNCATSVDAKTGVFKMVITDEFQELLEANQDICHKHKVTLRADWRKSAISPQDRVYALTSVTLENIKNAINEGITLLLNTEVTEELVIQYAMRTTCQFWLNGDGTISPCGGSADADKGGKWTSISKTPNGWDNEHMYSLGVGACVRVRQTHKTARGETVKFVSLAGAVNTEWRSKENYPVMHRLNEFTHLRLPEDSPTMPYSDEAAIFFTDMLMGLCNTANRLAHFFGDQQRVNQAIENKAGMFLLGGK